jgi:hypothetical protein
VTTILSATQGYKENVLEKYGREVPPSLRLLQLASFRLTAAVSVLTHCRWNLKGIEKYGEDTWRNMKEIRKDVGTAMHNYCESYMLGTPVPPVRLGLGREKQHGCSHGPVLILAACAFARNTFAFSILPAYC